MLQGKGEIFRPEESPVVSPDPADTKFLDCAQAARADFIVTGNKRDFPDGSYGATRVVSAGELLDRARMLLPMALAPGDALAAVAGLRELGRLQSRASFPAELLREGGASVAILDLPGGGGAAAAAAIGATFHPCDVRDEAGVEEALEAAVAAHGGLHVAVNTAGGGFSIRSPIPPTWRRCWHVRHVMRKPGSPRT